jgi:hypothetical protein
MPQVEIHVKGSIGPRMADWFQGMTIEPVSPGMSCLCCTAADNSAIYGILSTLSSLGLTLVSVSVTDCAGGRALWAKRDGI